MSDTAAAERPNRHRTITIDANAGPPRATARVCEAASCVSGNASDITARLTELTEDKSDVLVKRVGCLGLCAAGPLVEIAETGELFEHVTPDTIDPLVKALGKVKPDAKRQAQGPFFEKQVRVATENFGVVDPESLDDYIAAGGFQALRRVLSEMTSAEVRDEVMASGLRGRGGAGFPTGLKWTTVAKATGDKKYVICNADEGDPGAFMDRSVLESDPFRVLEGMAIAAFAVHAAEGYVYCRAEYPLAVKRLRTAIRLAQRAGYLGDNIMDTSFGFSVQIRLGAGAFVCGEETALIASVEGRRGTPRPRPPYPAVSGLWGSPTLINNVESLASVPTILRDGPEKYAAIGVGKSKGTKVFALAGRVVNTGLVEVPMGMTLREIIFDIGGGIIDGRALQGRPDRRPVGWLYPGRAPRYAGQLRDPHRARLVHGLGRHDHHGRHVLHGRCRQVLPGLLSRRVVRQVHALPRGHHADVHAPRPDHQGRGDRGRPGPARAAGRHRPEDVSLRPGPGRPQPDLQHAALLQG